jgi:ABC-type multidrug transport system fused ATPase/permease subunit
VISLGFLGQTIGVLFLVWLCLLIANWILLGIIMYIDTVIDGVNSFKFNREIRQKVFEEFERRKKEKFEKVIE